MHSQNITQNQYNCSNLSAEVFNNSDSRDSFDNSDSTSAILKNNQFHVKGQLISLQQDSQLNLSTTTEAQDIQIQSQRLVYSESVKNLSMLAHLNPMIDREMSNLVFGCNYQVLTNIQIPQRLIQYNLQKSEPGSKYLTPLVGAPCVSNYSLPDVQALQQQDVKFFVDIPTSYNYLFTEDTRVFLDQIGDFNIGLTTKLKLFIKAIDSQLAALTVQFIQTLLQQQLPDYEVYTCFVDFFKAVCVDIIQAVYDVYNHFPTAFENIYKKISHEIKRHNLENYLENQQKLQKEGETDIQSFSLQVEIQKFKKDVSDLLSKIYNYDICHIMAETTKHLLQWIHKGDTIVLVGNSSLLIDAVIAANQQPELKNSFHVVVMDVLPQHACARVCKILANHHVKYSYTIIQNASFVMRRYKQLKVFASAFSINQNGDVLARAGTSSVASICQLIRVPFIVASESFKFGQTVLENESFLNSVAACQNSQIATGLALDITSNSEVVSIVCDYGSIRPSSVGLFINK